MRRVLQLYVLRRWRSSAPLVCVGAIPLSLLASVLFASPSASAVSPLLGFQLLLLYVNHSCSSFNSAAALTGA
jgi:hypothetical protein